MEGFTQILDYNDLQDGDILLAPPKAKALHVTPKTFASHGIPISSRAHYGSGRNLDTLILEWFTNTAGTGLAMMVVSHRNAEPQERGPITNSFPAQRNTQLQSFAAMRVNDYLLPYSDPNSNVLAFACKPLRTRLIDKFTKIAESSLAYARLEYYPEAQVVYQNGGLRSNEPEHLVWRALRNALSFSGGSGMYALSHVPSGVTHSESLNRHVDSNDLQQRYQFSRLAAVGPTEGAYYRQPLYGPYNAFMLNDLRSIQYVFSHGMEIWRPSDEATWTRLTDIAFARYVKFIVENDFRNADRILTKFQEQYARDLAEYQETRDWWNARLAEYQDILQNPPASPFGQKEQT